MFPESFVWVVAMCQWCECFICTDVLSLVHEKSVMFAPDPGQVNVEV